MKSTRVMTIMAAVASLGVATAAPETQDDRDRRNKTPPPDRAPPVVRRQKPPRDLTEADVRRLAAANEKRARRAARNLVLAKVSE